MDNNRLNIELRNFLDSSGRLKAYPAKFKLKILSLYYLASKLQPGLIYTEQQLNRELINWHTFEDWAMLRRELYNRHFIDRAPDGTGYWLEENQPEIETFGL